MKLKDIKATVASGYATDYTNATIKDPKAYEEIGISYGTYGMNGGLFQNRETGELIAIIGRATNLFILA